MNRKTLGPGEGLELPGPLSTELGTIKVGVRPPDIPLIERMEELISTVKDSGVDIPAGTSVAIRSFEGFVYFGDISRTPIEDSTVLRVIEYDPMRGTFLVGGDGRADRGTEICWYVLRALPDIHVVLVERKGKESDSGGMERLVGKEEHVRSMVNIAAALRERGHAEYDPFTIRGFATLDSLEKYMMKRGNDVQSRSQ